MKLLALDFDGVISDSAPECFVVALRTLIAVRPGSRLAPALAALDDFAPDRVRAHPLFRPFLEILPLGNRAEDYGVELLAIEQGKELADQAAYDAHRDALPRAFLEGFHRCFYEQRRALREADPERWRALMGPYPDFNALLRRRAADVTLAIATAKDRRSVQLLLRDYGIADLFAPELVLDKDAGASKRAHLRALRDRTAVEFSEITFVDDKVNHLDDVAPLGVRCALAAWGYNGPRERRIAEERRYRVCTLENAEARLF